MNEIIQGKMRFSKLYCFLRLPTCIWIRNFTGFCYNNENLITNLTILHFMLMPSWKQRWHHQREIMFLVVYQNYSLDYE